MSICPNCKTRLAANARFCSGCGMQIKVDELGAREIALIQNELSHCRLNEIIANLGLVGGLGFGFLSVMIINSTLVTVLGFGLAVLCIILSVYYSNKSKRLKEKLKGR